MKLTLEITVCSPDEYLCVLELLDEAADSGKLDFKFTAKPALSSIEALAEHAMKDKGKHPWTS